jgi:hypothetical protein
MSQLQTPVLLLIFNRPDFTQKTFDEIKKAQPKQLFVAADGQRKNNTLDAEQCPKTRAIIEQIDWPCDVKTLFRNKNLGCGKAVSSAIDWFFEQVEAGIILEDDCLPNTDFFYFCQEMLARYKNDTRIFHVNGCNFQKEQPLKDYSYCFYNFPHIWGWATWKRAWQHYDFEMKSFKNFERNKIIKDLFHEEPFQDHWFYFFKSMHEKKYNTWDFQWVYTVFMQNGLCVSPEKNLITNLGGPTKNNPCYIPREQMDVENIKHPPFIVNCKTKNFWTMTKLWHIKSKYNILHKLKELVRKKLKTYFPFLVTIKRKLKGEPANVK